MPEFVTFTDYYTGAPVAVRTAYLAAKAVHAAHVDGCFPCSLEWATDCEHGQALRAAADAAWERYEGVRP